MHDGYFGYGPSGDDYVKWGRSKNLERLLCAEALSRQMSGTGYLFPKRAPSEGRDELRSWDFKVNRKSKSFSLH